jgi:hypothetical protein
MYKLVAAGWARGVSQQLEVNFLSNSHTVSDFAETWSVYVSDIEMLVRVFWQPLDYCGRCFYGVCEEVCFAGGPVVGNFWLPYVARNIFCTGVW